jgi:hypothetical protein
MSIINIGSRLDLVQSYISGLTGISTTFAGGFFSGKPIVEPAWLYAYFTLDRNAPKISSDVNGIIRKEATLTFAIVEGQIDSPDVVLYEALDTLSNQLCTECNDSVINLSWFYIYSIEEGNQSGVIRWENHRAYIVADYTLIYKYRY